MKAVLLKPDAASEKCAAYDQLLSVHLDYAQWGRSVFFLLCICVHVCA